MESTEGSTQQLMFSLIEIWKTSGKTQKEFCREKDLAYHKFHYWFSKYNAERDTERADLSSSFTQVVVKERKVTTTGALELQYPDGRKLVFLHGVDVSFLRALLA